MTPDLCRICGDLSYLADGEGPVHPCCALWRAGGGTGMHCPHCAMSKRLARERGERAAPQLLPSGRKRRVPHR